MLRPYTSPLNQIQNSLTMQHFSLFLFLFLFSNVGFSQFEEIDGVKFKLQKDWISDPFTTSSVCDCPGIIILDERNERKSLWIAIYPISKDYAVHEGHNFVWDYEFVSDSTGPEVLVIDGVKMHAAKGSYVTSDGESLPGYKITSARGKTSKSYDHIIHIYANNKVVLSEGKVAEFVNSIKWKG